MKRFLVPFTLAVLLFTGAWAQHRGSRNAGPGAGSQSATPKVLSPIEGKVTAIDLGIGQGTPSIAVEGTPVLLAPYFYLQSLGFTVEVGDRVQATVFPSLVYDDLLVTVSIDNLSQGVAADLRDEFGRPLWRNSIGGGRRVAVGACGSLPNVGAAETYTGVVASVEAAAGERYPTITLVDGPAFAAGPYRAWLQTDFSISPGDEISVLAFPCSADDSRWVAMKIVNIASGTQLVLRDDAGIPVYGAGRGARTMR
ncbi:MAG: hypothetical protein P8Y94_00620 [Acidobacteriota bacterium]